MVHRLGDPNTAGAPVIAINTVMQNVYANNRLIAVDLSPVKGHGPAIHSGPRTYNGSNNVFIENIPVNRIGDPDTCGHPRAVGSPNVFVN